MGNACTFCGIIAGQIPAHYVLQEDAVVGFLDTRPLRPGHVLVVPREHHVTLPELPVTLLEPLFECVQRVARAVVVALGAEGTFVAMNNVVSQSVPHLHVHVVPRSKGDGLKGFFWPRLKYASDDEARDFARRIRQSLGIPPGSMGV